MKQIFFLPLILPKIFNTWHSFQQIFFFFPLCENRTNTGLPQWWVGVASVVESRKQISCNIFTTLDKTRFCAKYKLFKFISFKIYLNNKKFQSLPWCDKAAKVIIKKIIRKSEKRDKVGRVAKTWVSESHLTNLTIKNFFPYGSL